MLVFDLLVSPCSISVFSENCVTFVAKTDSSTQIEIVNPKNNQKVTVYVTQTTNIIKQQNQLIESGCTGLQLINQFIGHTARYAG